MIDISLTNNMTLIINIKEEDFAKWRDIAIELEKESGGVYKGFNSVLYQYSVNGEYHNLLVSLMAYNKTLALKIMFDVNASEDIVVAGSISVNIRKYNLDSLQSFISSTKKELDRGVATMFSELEDVPFSDIVFKYGEEKVVNIGCKKSKKK
jgi:hypothetical protein